MVNSHALGHASAPLFCTTPELVLRAANGQLTCPGACKWPLFCTASELVLRAANGQLTCPGACKCATRRPGAFRESAIVIGRTSVGIGAGKVGIPRSIGGPAGPVVSSLRSHPMAVHLQ